MGKQTWPNITDQLQTKDNEWPVCRHKGGPAADEVRALSPGSSPSVGRAGNCQRRSQVAVTYKTTSQQLLVLLQFEVEGGGGGPSPQLNKQIRLRALVIGLTSNFGIREVHHGVH